MSRRHLKPFAIACVVLTGLSVCALLGSGGQPVPCLILPVICGGLILLVDASNRRYHRSRRENQRRRLSAAPRRVRHRAPSRYSERVRHFVREIEPSGGRASADVSSQMPLQCAIDLRHVKPVHPKSPAVIRRALLLIRRILRGSSR